MKLLTSKNRLGINLLGILVIGIVVAFASSDAMGQGRGRRVSHLDRKCAKFVNCHDARDGRLDGRGPNRDTGVTNIFRRHRRHRDRDFEDISRRRRNRDRDFEDIRWRRRR
jgi:hypothetical protein